MSKTSRRGRNSTADRHGRTRTVDQIDAEYFPIDRPPPHLEVLRTAIVDIFAALAAGGVVLDEAALHLARRTMVKALLTHYGAYLTEMKEHGHDDMARAPRVFVSEMRNYMTWLSDAQKKTGAGSVLETANTLYRDVIGRTDKVKPFEFFSIVPGSLGITRTTRLPTDANPLRACNVIFRKIRSSFIENNRTICGPSGMSMNYLDDIFTTEYAEELHRVYTLDVSLTGTNVPENARVPVAFCYFKRYAYSSIIKLELLCAKSDASEIYCDAANAPARKPSLARYLFRHALFDMLGEYTKVMLDALSPNLVVYYWALGFELMPRVEHEGNAALTARVVAMQAAVVDAFATPDRDQRYDRVVALLSTDEARAIYFYESSEPGAPSFGLFPMEMTDFTKVKAMIANPEPTQDAVVTYLNHCSISLFSQNVPMTDFVGSCVQCGSTPPTRQRETVGGVDARVFCDVGCQLAYYRLT
jgi:hypothetical protein